MSEYSVQCWHIAFVTFCVGFIFMFLTSKTCFMRFGSKKKEKAIYNRVDEHYQALSSASMSNGTVRCAGEHRWSTRPASRQNGQIVYLLTSFFFLSSVRTVSQASTITAEAITTKKSRKNIINHRVLHSPPIARKELGMVGEFQNSHVLVCLPIYAIFLNKTVT